MNVDSINNGYVIDHIKAGDGMTIYQILNLENFNCSVALITNAISRKHGRKDIIKIDDLIDIDLNVLGYIDPLITINVIKDGKLIEKRCPALPEQIRDVIQCKNPRCITSVERALPQVFKLTDREKHVYRCIYCETAAKRMRRL